MTYQKISIPPAPRVLSPLSPLDGRLEAAVKFIRGGVVADVGTDHAYLPISLLRRRLCTFAVATDIHRGPAEVAAAHLSMGGIGEDRAAVLLSDGLHGAEQFSPSDICIFGMGGEMIAHIIDEAPWVRSPDVRLILQPMTKADALREYLDRSGFAVREECLVRTDRIYQILCVEYDGAVREHTPLERLIGAHNLSRHDAACDELIERLRKSLEASRRGKQSGKHPDTSREDALLGEIAAYQSQSEVTQ